MKYWYLILPLAILTASCESIGFNGDNKSSRELVQADVKKYKPETQDKLRKELQAQGCLPVEGKDFNFLGCKIPVAFSLLIDFYKMREQTRVAK